MSSIPENNVSSPISQMSLYELKASFLMTMQDLERKREEFLRLPIASFTKDQINQIYRDLHVLWRNLESIEDRIGDELEAQDG